MYWPPLSLLQMKKKDMPILIFLITHEFDKVRILFSGPEDKLQNPSDLVCEF